MEIQDFSKRLEGIEAAVKRQMERDLPKKLGNLAVRMFKENFQKESFFGRAWQEVKRRTPGTAAFRTAARNHPSRTTRKILTGDTGDLARSIEVKYVSKGEVVVWTAPSAFAKEPYGRVHNEGLRAGRGSGFIMPKRQFMGESEELNALIISEIERKLKQISKQ